MDWREKALKTMIAKMIEKEKELTVFFYALDDIGITFDNKIDDCITDILMDVTSWEALYENLEAYHNGEFTLQQITELVYKFIEDRFNK